MMLDVVQDTIPDLMRLWQVVACRIPAILTIRDMEELNAYVFSLV